MCDYSLQSVKTRVAAVADRLVTTNFGSGTVGFAEIGGDMAPNQWGEDMPVAVCLLPGTEVAFEAPVMLRGDCFAPDRQTEHTVARFRQIDKEVERTHHDALEFPDGEVVLLTAIAIKQTATVLQLPATPKTEAEAEEQKRVVFAG